MYGGVVLKRVGITTKIEVYMDVIKYDSHEDSKGISDVL
jgi:hypothetical protein